MNLTFKDDVHEYVVYENDELVSMNIQHDENGHFEHLNLTFEHDVHEHDNMQI